MEVLALAGTLIRNGIYSADIARVSDKYAVPVTPAKFTFLIWAVIYCLWGVAVLQNLGSPVNGYFLLGLAASNAWLEAWRHERLDWSAVWLASYVAATALLDPGTSAVWGAARSVTLSWTAAATALNVLACLKQRGATEMQLQTLSRIAVIALVSDGARALFAGDLLYTAARIWALAGIACGRT